MEKREDERKTIEQMMRRSIMEVVQFDLLYL